MTKEVLDKLFGAAKGMAEAAYSPGMQHFVEHGAHEVAAALFNGNGFVMYPRAGKDDQQPDHGLENQGMEQEQQQRKGMSL